MNRMKRNHRALRRRRYRVRNKVEGSSERPRLSVRRSLKNIYVQIVDDVSGKTLAAASTRSPEIRGEVTYGGNAAAAAAVGKLIAERAAAKSIQTVVFDRGGRKYHGRVKALADAAREGGLKF